MAAITVNRNKLLGTLSQGLQGFAADADTLFTQAIESPVYEWPGETRRRNGSTVGSPRDIVDLGDFRDSQSYKLNGPTSLTYTWSAEHSVYVFLGFTSRNGTSYPGRNPVLQAMADRDFAQLMADNLRRYAR